MRSVWKVLSLTRGERCVCGVIMTRTTRGSWVIMSLSHVSVCLISAHCSPNEEEMRRNRREQKAVKAVAESRQRWLGGRERVVHNSLERFDAQELLSTGELDRFIQSVMQSTCFLEKNAWASLWCSELPSLFPDRCLNPVELFVTTSGSLLLFYSIIPWSNVLLLRSISFYRWVGASVFTYVIEDICSPYELFLTAGCLQYSWHFGTRSGLVQGTVYSTLVFPPFYSFYFLATAIKQIEVWFRTWKDGLPGR